MKSDLHHALIVFNFSYFTVAILKLFKYYPITSSLTVVDHTWPWSE